MSLIGPESRRQLKLAARFATVGIELAVSILVGYFGGGYLDGLFETEPYLTYTGLLVGIAAGFHSFYRLARSAQRDAGDKGRDTDRDSP